MRVRIRGAALAIVPGALSGAVFTAFLLGHGLLSTVGLAVGLSVLVTRFAVRHEESATPLMGRHFRHCALVYPWLLIGLGSYGEGLTRPLGPLILGAVAGIAVPNAFVLATLRSQWRPA